MQETEYKFVHPDTQAESKLVYWCSGGKHYVKHFRPVIPFDCFPCERVFETAEGASKYIEQIRQSLYQRGFIDLGPYRTRKDIEDFQRFQECLRQVSAENAKLRRGPFPWSDTKTQEEMWGF